jgi:hypothetical protein
VWTRDEIAYSEAPTVVAIEEKRFVFETKVTEQLRGSLYRIDFRQELCRRAQ